MSEPDRILNDFDYKKQKNKESSIRMGSLKYKQTQLNYGFRQRTLKNKYQITDKVIKDDSVQIYLREDCQKCHGQLLEPKLKKALLGVDLDPSNFKLLRSPKCIFCGNEIDIPKLKITHGRASKTFRTDRAQRHRHIQVEFLSALQVNNKI